MATTALLINAHGILLTTKWGRNCWDQSFFGQMGSSDPVAAFKHHAYQQDIFKIKLLSVFLLSVTAHPLTTLPTFYHQRRRINSEPTKKHSFSTLGISLPTIELKETTASVSLTSSNKSARNTTTRTKNAYNFPPPQNTPGSFIDEEYFPTYVRPQD